MLQVKGDAEQLHTEEPKQPMGVQFKLSKSLVMDKDPILKSLFFPSRGMSRSQRFGCLIWHFRNEIAERLHEISHQR